MFIFTFRPGTKPCFVSLLLLLSLPGLFFQLSTLSGDLRKNKKSLDQVTILCLPDYKFYGEHFGDLRLNCDATNTVSGGFGIIPSHKRLTDQMKLM